MTEQELTELVRKYLADVAADEEGQRHAFFDAVASGYLALLAEREALIKQREEAFVLFQRVDAERDALKAQIQTVLENVVDAAEQYAALACAEFCVHSTDKPESCPTNDPRISVAAELIRP
jgi:hypothetical protein